jgi:hypothetical protein
MKRTKRKEKRKHGFGASLHFFTITMAGFPTRPPMSLFPGCCRQLFGHFFGESHFVENLPGIHLIGGGFVEAQGDEPSFLLQLTPTPRTGTFARTGLVCFDVFMFRSHLPKLLIFTGRTCNGIMPIGQLEITGCYHENFSARAKRPAE